MESTIERVANKGKFHHYVVTVGPISGEVISIPDYAEAGINEMLIELRRALIQ